MSYGRLVAENNLLKKRLEESHTNLARLQETQSRREKEVAEDNMAAQVKIRDLESKLKALQTIFEGILKDHSVIYAKFISAREETDRLNARLLDAANEMAVYRNKAETLSQSVLNIKMKFRKAKERLREYKEKAQSFY
jgi:chromosome segregation ATPase